MFPHHPSSYFNVETCGGELSRISANLFQPTWRHRRATVPNIEIWGGGGTFIPPTVWYCGLHDEKRVRDSSLRSIVTNHCAWGKRHGLIAVTPSGGNSYGFSIVASHLGAKKQWEKTCAVRHDSGW